MAQVYKKKQILQKHVNTEHSAEEGSQKAECPQCGKVELRSSL